MKKFKYKNLGVVNTILHILLFSIPSCKDFLDIPSPKTELETERVYTNSKAANSAVLGIYSNMVNNDGASFYISQLSGLWTDEFTNHSTDPLVISFYSNSLSPSNEYLLSRFWSSAYLNIYQANLVLESLEKSNSLDDNLKNQLSGEAKFVRAFSHFYLLNFFSDIPLVTSTDYNKNSTIARSGQGIVYKNIISDLESAESLLNANYVGVDGLTETDERVRPNKSCASALLARVYLYKGDFINAEIASTKVIQGSSNYTLESPGDAFLKNSKETIWALQPFLVNGYNTPEAYFFTLTGPPNSSSSNCVTISNALFNAFEPQDMRKQVWVSAFDTFYYPSKYKAISTDELAEYSICLRLAEQYLIRAEARAQNNKIGESLMDLNLIRKRAGLNELDISNKSPLLDAIFRERRVELFGEWAHRWFDVRRRNDINTIMQAITRAKGRTWDSHKINFPIPESERRKNAALSQNAGY